MRGEPLASRVFSSSNSATLSDTRAAMLVDDITLLLDEVPEESLLLFLVSSFDKDLFIVSSSFRALLSSSENDFEGILFQREGLLPFSTLSSSRLPIKAETDG